MRRIAALTAALAAAVSALLAGSASATTGDTYILPPSRYVIPPEVTGQFFGSYNMTHAGSGTKLYAANIFITSNTYGDLYGGGSFYGYDSTGAQTSWTNILYDFRLVTPDGKLATPAPWTTAGQVADDQLAVTLYGWGSPSLGTMTLRRQRDGDLAGTIRLYGQTQSFPIGFHRIGNATAAHD